jgi:ketol-acid reductoisomerase
LPVFSELYESVVSGHEARIVLEANNASNYREKLQEELDEMKNSEMWRAGRAVRELRPERRKKS